MGSILLNTLGILAPKTFDIFLILMAIGFFGIYIPWKERHKKREGRPAPGQEKAYTAMSRAQALAAMIGCMPIMTVGLTMLIASAVMGLPLFTALGALLSIASLMGMMRAGKDFRAAKGSAPQNRPQPPRKPQTPPGFRADSPDHQHITPTGPSVRRQLEQLDTLKEAGLLTKEEYAEKRRQLEKEG